MVHFSMCVLFQRLLSREPIDQASAQPTEDGEEEGGVAEEAEDSIRTSVA